MWTSEAMDELHTYFDCTGWNIFWPANNSLDEYTHSSGAD